MLNKSIKFLIENKLVAVLLLVLFVGWGTVNAPFNWNTGFLPSNPVAVDAIPDIGENQQIVFTKWDGHSPQDIEDQITYPLTTSLLGIPSKVQSEEELLEYIYRVKKALDLLFRHEYSQIVFLNA